MTRSSGGRARIRRRKKVLIGSWLSEHFPNSHFLVIPKYRRTEWTAALAANLDVAYEDGDDKEGGFVFRLPER